jgi:AcrR family transcriptional regulator
MPPATRDTILRTARKLFMRQGYTATSMRQVAAEAGIGKATIYHHFPDKESLAFTLLDGQLAGMEEVVAAARAESDPRCRFQTIAVKGIAHLLESGDIFQVMRREVPGGRARMQTAVVSFFKNLRASMAEALRKGMEQGTFRKVDPDEAARVFLTMLQGTFAAAYVAGERPVSPQDAAQSLLEIYFRGINAERPAGKGHA